MFTRTCAVICLAWCLVPSLGFGQVSEEEDREAIHSAAKAAKGKQSPDLSQVKQIIITKTNAFRKEQSFQAVQGNAQLTETAQYFADYMARTSEYGHTADGNRPAERAKKHGYAYCIVSENIAYQFSSLDFATQELGQKFFEGWKNSPGHRKNMLDPDVTETGVAIAQSEETGYYYAVQMFGRPKADAFAFKIENLSSATIEYKIRDRAFPLPPRYTRTHQQCRPADLTFQWPGKEGGTQTVQPASGSHFLVTQNQNSFQAKKK